MNAAQVIAGLWRLYDEGDPARLRELAAVALQKAEAAQGARRQDYLDDAALWTRRADEMERIIR